MFNDAIKERMRMQAAEERLQEERRAKRHKKKMRQMKRELTEEGRLIAEGRLKARELNKWAALEADIRAKETKYE